MKPKYWVSIALTLLTMLAGYQQYKMTSSLVEQELPARLANETQMVISQLDDYMSSTTAQHAIVIPQIRTNNIGYSLTTVGRSHLQPIMRKLTPAGDINYPDWFPQLFVTDALSYRHVFYDNSVKKAVLSTEISVVVVMNHCWWALCWLALVYLVSLSVSWCLLHRQDIRHKIMIERFRAGLTSIGQGEFRSIRQLRKDSLFRGLVIEFNQLVAEISHRNRAESKEKQRLSTAALFDDLTGFGNKPLFNETMNSQINGSNARGHLVLLRLQSLDQINIELGFDEGDAYISKISHLLAKMCGSSSLKDHVFRVSGRDIAAILPAKKGVMIEPWAEDFKNSLIAMDTPAYKQGCGFFSAIAYDNTSLLEDLMVNLESGLSKAMTQSANNYSVIKSDDDASEGVTNWFNVVNQIVNTKGVMLNKQQLKHHADNKSLYNFELFTSFVLDGKFYVAKDIFAAAKRFSMSADLDKIIIEKVSSFSQAAAVTNARYLIKLSYDSIQDMDFYYWLKQWLTAENELASQLTFELSELAITQNFIIAKQFISMLHAANCSVCLDYEGSQYSHQLSQSIGELSIDMVKVDSHYTHRVNTHTERASFVAALVEVAHSVNVPVIASQVEDDEEWNILESLGVDAVQGNLFGHVRPV